MSRSTTFFRRVWRVNAVLILVAAAVLALGAGAFVLNEFAPRAAWRHEPAAGPLGATSKGEDLVLGRDWAVDGTGTMRAELVARQSGKGISSGGYGETRNILFIAPGEPAARWLLPDHDHVIAETHDVVQQEEQPTRSRTLATAVVVKKREAEPDAVGGRLILFNPSGTSIVDVADGVRTVHTAALSDGEIVVLFERDHRLWLAALDPQSLVKRREQLIDVPVLK